jgi:hypothetical protein
MSRGRRRDSRALPALLGLVAVATAACDGSQMRYAPCEQRGYLTVRTVDGAATIASVDISSGCNYTALCVPGSATPCAQVTVMANTASSCTVTLTSVDGRSVSVTASLVGGASYTCRDSTGQIHTVQSAGFVPSTIEIDFATASVPDGGSD